MDAHTRFAEGSVLAERFWHNFHRETVNPSLPGKLLTLLILLLVATDLGLGVQAARKRRKPKGPTPFRLGIHHSHPALCPSDEPSQRDLRVLRLAFDVGRYSRQWRNLPWFYFSKKITKKTTGKTPPGTALMEIFLSTRRLWGRRMGPANGEQAGMASAPHGGATASQPWEC